MLPADPRVGVAEGFTFVEIIVGALIAGIFAAIVVFSVVSVTHKSPDPVCTNDVRKVQMAIAAYQVRNNNTNPATLDVLVKQKLLPAVPSPSSPSGAAGYTYNPVSGSFHGRLVPEALTVRRSPRHSRARGAAASRRTVAARWSRDRGARAAGCATAS